MATHVKPILRDLDNIALELVNAKRAAEILGVSAGTLAIWRSTQRYDLPFVKVGRRCLYNMRDIAEFVARGTVRRTEPK